MAEVLPKYVTADSKVELRAIEKKLSSIFLTRRERPAKYREITANSIDRAYN